jgi:hypothetical protein
MPPTTLKEVYLPRLGHSTHFRHRDTMRMRASFRTFRLPKAGLPPTTLPVDCTNNAQCVWPMDANDAYGICGPAMAAHVDNILTYAQGKGTESFFNVTNLLNQYLKVAGGDNGTDEPEVVDQIWKVGIAGDKTAVCVDSLDINVTDTVMAQFAIDNFYHVCMAWSVPDAFINQFNTGIKFLKPMTPDPANGHFTPISDIDISGNYRLITWGTWCWVSPSFIASVEPQCFVVFSPRQFDPKTGLDSRGRHIATQAALWLAAGGNPIPLSVINAFPPIGGPVPTPTPGPGPTPTPDPVPTPSAGVVTVAINDMILAIDGLTLTLQPDPSQWSITGLSPTPTPVTGPEDLNWLNILALAEELITLTPQALALVQQLLAILKPLAPIPVPAVAVKAGNPGKPSRFPKLKLKLKPKSGRMTMSKSKSLSPPTPGTDTGSQTLFDELDTITAVQTYLTDGPSTPGLPPLDPATVTALQAVLTADAQGVSALIAANIVAATPTGQPFPDVVVSLEGNVYMVNLDASGNPQLDVAVIVNASDIPLAAPSGPPPGGGGPPPAPQAKRP